MSPPSPPVARPTNICLHRRSAVLEVEFASGEHFQLPAEFLRVYSPSAEVRGHGQEETTLIPGKRNVQINKIVPVGRYAVRLVFSDGHDTGLYSWDVLMDLGREQQALWQDYVDRMQAAGMSRDSDIVKLAGLARKYVPAPKTP